ncbi:hypothetical protein [Microcystis phage Mel-JY33]
MDMTYEERSALALQRREKLRELHAELVPGKVYVAVDAGAYVYGVNGNIHTLVVRLEKITPQQLRVSRWVGDAEFNDYPDRLAKASWVLIEVPDAQTGAAWLADIRKDHDLDGAVEELRRAENEVRKVKARMYRDILAAIPGYPLGPEVTE